MKFPNLNYEQDLWKKGFTVIGIDEVGRGAFAGPLFAAGVIFTPTKSEKQLANLLSHGINDSKKLTADKREMLDKVIRKEAFAIHISSISVAEINRIGIGKANHKAMRDVVRNLTLALSYKEREIDSKRIFVLVDGFEIKNLKGIGLNNQKAIIHGDGISLSIAAASIIAKVARDNYMKNLSEHYSEFGWDQNKGYGTLFHREALAKHGATPLHRTDFIKNLI